MYVPVGRRQMAATTSASPTPQGANEHDSCRTPAPNVTGKSHTVQWVLLPFR